MASKDHVELKDVIARIGLNIRNEDLLREAFTHASLPAASGRNYQALEFLGDRILALIIAEELYRRAPQSPEGGLSLRFKKLVRTETLSEIATELGLGSAIRADRQGRSTIQASRNVLADVCEALIGAVYLDGGLDQARSFVLTHWASRFDDLESESKDPKSMLQEWAAGEGLPPPAYAVVERSGPAHDPVFRVKATLPGRTAEGEGKSKREAEQSAALKLLTAEGVVSGG
jgi:ribonuclease-3